MHLSSPALSHSNGLQDPSAPSAIAAIPTHGGADVHGRAEHDFSTNANACGPCPLALSAVQAADAAHYPDPAYSALRDRLADRHQVAANRIVLAASASEAIARITAVAVQIALCDVVTPMHAYGDYARAASAWSMRLRVRSKDGSHAVAPALHWWCDPSSPLGHAAPFGSDGDAQGSADWHVVDCAYAPLRLAGVDPSVSSDRSSDASVVWQLWSPNKALGLTGIRAAYLVAPPLTGEVADQLARLEALAPSWPVGAHGVAMLGAWCEADVATWLAESLGILRQWKARQTAVCESLGWQVLASGTSFFCARLPGDVAGGGSVVGQRRINAWLAQLRGRGVKLRDCASFGLPGHVRLGVLPPRSQDALAAAVRAIGTMGASVFPMTGAL